MDENALKQLFDADDIPAPDANARKVHLNLAVAEFEKVQKNAKTSQGNGFFARLISRQPLQRSEKMSFSQKKIVYGGLATACVALMVFATLPKVTEQATERISAQLAVSPEADSADKQIVAEKKVKTEFREMEKAAAPAATPPLMDGGAGGSVQGLAMAPVPVERRMMAKDMAVATEAMPAPSMPAGQMVQNYMVNPVIADYPGMAQQEFGRDNFEHVAQNAIHQVKTDPVSTFSIDVDTASYSFMRSSLNQGLLPQVDAVRIEELINYFDYDYPLPQTKEQPFTTNVVLTPSPWGDGKQLMTVGIRGYDIPKTQMPNSNLVFLLDVSGSMNEPNKLPLLKQSISMLLDTLKPTDTVSIVVYAGAAGTVLPPTKVQNKASILAALQNLQPGGGTAGAEGIRQAYQLAEVNFDKNAVNRVILGTDGDFNVGITDPEELKNFVSREKDKGIFLSVLGFGRGNYNDEMMQKLAQNGNGVAAYIDNLNEARKVLVEEATSTLFPIAKDVKIQVEFNPAIVAEYRLVGYETRALKTEDFNNDKVDAGDIGAGAEVTAIYELTPVGGKTAIDQSRYADKILPKKETASELAFVKIRYKLPDANESKLITTPVTKDQREQITPLISQETNWAVAVASFGQFLKGGMYNGRMTIDDIIALAQANKGNDPYGYRAEFINLLYLAKSAQGLQPQPGGQGVVIPAPEPMPYPYPVPQTR